MAPSVHEIRLARVNLHGPHRLLEVPRQRAILVHHEGLEDGPQAIGRSTPELDKEGDFLSNVVPMVQNFDEIHEFCTF